MASYYTGLIKFERNGSRAVLPLPGCPSLSVLRQFATDIVGFTTAKVLEISWTETDVLDTAEGTGDYADVKLLLQVKMRQSPAPNGRRKIKKLPLPAPDAANMENIAGLGYRLKQSVGDQIAARYSTLTGVTWVFEEGRLVGPNDV